MLELVKLMKLMRLLGGNKNLSSIQKSEKLAKSKKYDLAKRKRLNFIR